MKRQKQIKQLKMVSLRLPKHDIQVDEYYNITACYRWFSLRDRATNNCPKGKIYKICSKCSLEGHVGRDCKERKKKMAYLVEENMKHLR